MIDVARRFTELGFPIKATIGTQEFLARHGIESERVYKMREKRPHLADAIMDGEIQLVINTPRGKASKADDSYIRKAAIRHKIPYITTVAAANATVKGIAALKGLHNEGPCSTPSGYPSRFNPRPASQYGTHPYPEESVQACHRRGSPPARSGA